MNIYVGFLPSEFNDQLLKEKFEAFGEVISAKIVKDRETGFSKGFGFVEMKNTNEGQQAIEELQNWVKPDGKTVKVNEAQERPANSGNSNQERKSSGNNFNSGGERTSQNKPLGGGRKW